MIITRENMRFVGTQPQPQTQPREGLEALSQEEVAMGAWAADPDRPLASIREASSRWPELGARMLTNSGECLLGCQSGSQQNVSQVTESRTQAWKIGTRLLCVGGRGVAEVEEVWRISSRKG